MNTRQTNTHPSKKGRDQTTNYMKPVYSESDQKRMSLTSHEKSTLKRGEEEVAKIVTPV